MSTQLPELTEEALETNERYTVMRECSSNPSRAMKYESCCRPLVSYEHAVSWAEYIKSENPRKKGNYVIVKLCSRTGCM